MSLPPPVIAPVPEATVRVARAAFPQGHPSLTFRDALGTVFQDEDFTALFPLEGQPGLPRPRGDGGVPQGIPIDSCCKPWSS